MEISAGVVQPSTLGPVIFTLLIGIAVALLATSLVVAYQRAPTRVHRPECGGATEPVMPPLWLRKAAPRLHVRWCPQCSWQGLGRAGPEWVAGHKIAHDSGFRFASAPGRTPVAGRAQAMAAHPSGFVWKEVVTAPRSREIDSA